MVFAFQLKEGGYIQVWYMLYLKNKTVFMINETYLKDYYDKQIFNKIVFVWIV